MGFEIDVKGMTMGIKCLPHVAGTLKVAVFLPGYPVENKA
jgi:hypothetical protein